MSTFSVHSDQSDAASPLSNLDLFSTSSSDSSLLVRVQEAFHRVSQNFYISGEIRPLNAQDAANCETWRPSENSTLRSDKGSNFPRTLQRVLVENRQITYLVFSKNGDPCRNQGAFKSISLAVDIDTGNLAVRATMNVADRIDKIYADREMSFYAACQNIPNMVKITKNRPPYDH